MDSSGNTAVDGNNFAGRLSNSSSVSNSSGKSRSSGRRRRPVPDSPTRPLENAARKRRRKEGDEETTQHRVDGQEDDAGVATPAARRARIGLYGTMTSFVGRAMGFFTPNRGDIPAKLSPSPAASVPSDEPSGNEAGKDQPENEPYSMDEGNHPEIHQNTKSSFNLQGSGTKRHKDERSTFGGAVSSYHRSSFGAADFGASRRGMYASISEHPSTQPAPPNPESFRVFSPGIHMERKSPVPRRESGAGDGLGFASLRSTTGLDVDAPDSTPLSPRRGPLHDSSSRTTPGGSARGIAGECIGFGCGSQETISANGGGGGGGSSSSTEERKEEVATPSDSGDHDSTNGKKPFLTPGKVQGFVRAMRYRRGVPPMVAMYLLSKIESESAARLRLEILRLINDRPSDEKEDTSAGKQVPSQPVVARDELATGSLGKPDDSEVKRAVPLVAPVAQRPATAQKEGLVPSAALESSLMPPPPPSSRRRATMGPSAAAAVAANVGSSRRMSTSSRSEAGFGSDMCKPSGGFNDGVDLLTPSRRAQIEQERVTRETISRSEVGFGSGMRKPSGGFNDGVDLLTPSRRAQIEQERINRGKNESECVRRDRSFAHGTPGGARIWKPATSSSQGTPWAGRSQPVPLPERRLSFAQESPRRVSTPARRMSVAEESPRCTRLWGASTPGRNEPGTPAEMTRRIISVMEDMDTTKSPYLRGRTPARDSRDATPVYSRKQVEDGPLPTRTLSVPHPMGKMDPPGGGHPSAPTPARLPPSRWVRRSETLPERPDADSEKKTPHKAPLLTKKRDQGAGAADVSAIASAAPDSTDRGKENRSAVPRPTVDGTTDTEIKRGEGKGGGGKSVFVGHSPRSSAPLDATSESRNGKVNGSSVETSPAHGQGNDRDEKKDTERGHSKREREGTGEQTKRLKTLSGGSKARSSLGSSGGDEEVDPKAALPRSLRPSETKSAAPSQASTKFWTCQGCYARNYTMSAEICDMCGLPRNFHTSRRKNPPAYLVGGKIMHLGYHPGLAVAESRKSTGQKSTVTPPEEESSANNSAAKATVTTPSAPAPAPSATTVFEKPVAKRRVSFKLPESDANCDRVSAPNPDPAPSVAQAPASKSVPAFVPQLPTSSPFETAPPAPAPTAVSPGFVFGGARTDIAPPAAAAPSTTPGTTPTATLPHTVPEDPSTLKPTATASAVSTDVSKAESTSAGAPTLTAPFAVTKPPSVALNPTNPSSNPQPFVFGKADTLLPSNTSSSRSMFTFGKSSTSAGASTLGATGQPSFGAFAPAVAVGTATLGATPAAAPAAAVSVEGASAGQTAATSLKPSAPPAVIPAPQPIPGTSSNAFGGGGLRASSPSPGFSFSSGFTGTNKRSSSPAIIGSSGSASAFGGIGFGAPQAAGSSMAMGLTGASVATNPGSGLGFGHTQQPTWNMPSPAPVPPFNSQSVTPGGVATPAPALGGMTPQIPPVQVGAASPAMPNAVGTSMFNVGSGQKMSRRTVRARRNKR